MLSNIKSAIIYQSNDHFQEVFMKALTIEEAKTQFGDMISNAQQLPVQINNDDKAVAFVVGAEDYQCIERMKMELLKARAAQAKVDIKADNLIDGDTFMDELIAGQYD
jgi:PHD/YefM family antitoxin component YafN of YafNO toxin-antitoxin module